MHCRFIDLLERPLPPDPEAAPSACGCCEEQVDVQQLAHEVIYDMISDCVSGEYACRQHDKQVRTDLPLLATRCWQHAHPRVLCVCSWMH